MHIEAPTCCQMIWLLPEDIFKVPNQAKIGDTLKAQFGCETWLLDEDRSLAFSFPQLLADRGVPFDYQLVRKLVDPLFGYLNNWISFDPDRLSLKLPTPQFWVCILLPYNEVGKKHCMYISSDIAGYDSMTFQVFSRRPLEEKAASQLREFVEKWFGENGAAVIHGESLKCNTIDLQRFTTGDKANIFYMDGFQFTFESYTPVTWPWLDMYLKARRTFPKRNRPSFGFQN